jgi:O-methyltransferase
LRNGRQCRKFVLYDPLTSCRILSEFERPFKVDFTDHRFSGTYIWSVEYPTIMTNRKSRLESYIFSIFPRVSRFLYASARKTLRVFGLDLMLLILPRDFEQDGLATSRIRPFAEDSAFHNAKCKTIEAIGRDFKIDWRTHTFVWAFKSAQSLPGVSIELGTGKAWMFTFLLNHSEISTLGDLFLIDRFSSMAVDKKSGELIQGTENVYYTSNLDELKSRFSSESGVKFIQGELPQVLSEIVTDKIRFIHVDLNAAEPEVQSLRMLWDRLVPGGIVLLDDFGSPEFIDSNKAMRELSLELQFEILGLPTGQGLIIKSHSK